MNKLILKNYFFLNDKQTGMMSILDFLYNQTLHGKESRFRTKFINQMMYKGKEVENRRKELLSKYADKDEETGKPIYLTPEGKDTLVEAESAKYKISEENTKKFSDEYVAWLNEEFEVEVENVPMISSIGKILDDSTTPMFGKSSDIYDEWCLAFENVFAKNPVQSKEEGSSKKKSKK